MYQKSARGGNDSRGGGAVVYRQSTKKGTGGFQGSKKGFRSGTESQRLSIGAGLKSSLERKP